MNDIMNGWQTLDETIAASNGKLRTNTLRYLIRERHRNGFDTCLRKLGQCWFINTERFSEWMESRTEDHMVKEES